MSTKFNLSDSFCANGTDYDEFKKLVKEISSKTWFEDRDATYLKFVYKLAGEDFKDSKTGKPGYGVKIFSSADLAIDTMKGQRGSMLAVMNYDDARFNRELMDESFNTNGFMMMYKDPSHERDAARGRALYVSPMAKTTLCLRADVKGELTALPSLFLTEYVCESLARRKTLGRPVKDQQHNPKIKMVLRTDGKDMKVFGFMTTSYTEVKQEILVEVADRLLQGNSLGTPVVKEWFIDHDFTRLYMEFPEAAEEFASTYGLQEEVIPGLYLCTSDTGCSSVIVRGTYRRKKSNRYITVEEYSHRHQGRFNGDTVVEETENEVLAKIRRLPEALAEKMGRPIGNADLSTAKGQAENVDNVRRAIGNAFRELGIQKILGKGNSDAWKEMVIQGIDPASVYTEYDLAMLFMSLPDYLLEVPQFIQDQLAAACGRAPFISYSTAKLRGKKASEDVNNIIVLPQAV